MVPWPKSQAKGQEQGPDDFEKDLDRSMEELDRREGKLQTPSREVWKPFSLERTCRCSECGAR